MCSDLQAVFNILQEYARGYCVMLHICSTVVLSDLCVRDFFKKDKRFRIGF